MNRLYPRLVAQTDCKCWSSRGESNVQSRSIIKLLNEMKKESTYIFAEEDKIRFVTIKFMLDIACYRIEKYLKAK